MEIKVALSERLFARLKTPAIFVLTLAVLVGCSNGGGGGSDPNPTPPSSSLSSTTSSNSSTEPSSSSTAPSNSSTTPPSSSAAPVSSSATPTSSAAQTSSAASSTGPATLQGQVKTFPDTNTAAAKTMVRKMYDPAVLNSQNPDDGPIFQAGEDGGDGSFSRDDMVPARALVSIYLLSDVNFTTPIATVPTDENGNYTVYAEDVRGYLLSRNLIVDGAEDEDVLSAFRALGRLQVRAVVVRERDGQKKALAIQSIADPNDLDESTGLPTPVAVDPIVHRVVKQVVTQIRDAIQSLEDLGLSQTSIDSLTNDVISTVTTEIDRVLEESADSVITIPEGQTPEQVIASQENETQILLQDEQITQMESVINATEIDETLLNQVTQTTTDADALVEDSDSTLESSLESEAQGLLSGLEAQLNENLTDEFDELVEESSDLSTVFDTSGGQTTEEILAAAEAEKERLLRNSLQRFFLSMGLVVVLEENQAADAMVVAMRLPAPFHIPSADIPGGRYVDRNIRLFKVGSGTLDGDSKFTTDASANLGLLDAEDVPQNPLYFAQPLDEVNAALLNGATLADFQLSVDAAFAAISDPTAAPTADDFALIDRLNLYHDLDKRLTSANMVSIKLIEKIVSNRTATVQLKRLAAVIANNFTWAREVVNLTAEGFPIFTDREEPLSGGSDAVDSSEIVRALSLTLGASASEAAATLTSRVGFYAQFAPEAVQTNIERARFQQGANFDLEATLLDVYPVDAAGYKNLVLGTDVVPAVPAYQSARDRVARGLVSAVPATFYGQTLNSETSINIRSALFLLDFVLRSDFLVDPNKGYFRSFELASSGATEARYVPAFSNYKFLKAGDGITVSTLVSALLNITQIDNGALFRSARPVVLGGLGQLPVIPEFKEQDITEYESDGSLATRADTMSLTCSVQRFDGTDPQNADSIKDLQFTIYPVEYSSTGQFYKGDPITATVTSTASGDGPVVRTYTISGIPTQVDMNYGRDYVARLSIASYQNDLPELFFWADGFVPTLDLCPADAPLMIGADQQFVSIPGLGLMADQMRYDFTGQEQGIEGVDLSNFVLPGAPVFVSDQEETDGLGTRDFQFVSTDTGYALQAPAGSEAMFAPVTGGYEAGALTLSIDPASTLAPLYDLGGIVGASVRPLIESALANPSWMQASIDLDPANFDPHRVYLLKDADGKFWLLELRFIDVFEDDFSTTAQVFMDFGFTRINSLGEVVVPEAAFDSGPAPSPDVGGGIHFRTMLYGDWLVLQNPSNYNGYDLLEPEEVSFGGNAEMYTQLQQATDGVFFRYAGGHFDENITSVDDFDTVFGNPPDYISIPVRIEAGRAGISFVKLAFNKTDRKYVMSPLPENSASFVGKLKHNNIIAVFDDMAADPDSPVYLARVVRYLPADDPYANFEINLEIVDFAALQSDGTLDENDVVCFAEDAPEGICPTGLPSLQVNADGTTTSVGAVFDSDFDGVPALFDPNDSDPNIPGGAPTGGGTGTSGGHVGGLNIAMMAESDGQSGVTRSFLIETDGSIYPGDIQSVALNGAVFGDEQYRVLFTCLPPSLSDSGEFVDYQCTSLSVSDTISVELQAKLGDRVAFKLNVPEDTLLTLGNRTDLGFKVNFRAPTDLDGNPFMCGDTACPAQPAIEGMHSVALMSPDVVVLTDMSVTSGTDEPKSFVQASSLDVGRHLVFTGKLVPGAVDYELMVYCPGSLPGSTDYFPEEQFSFFAPARDPQGNAIAPRFDMDIPWISGRTCEFTFNALLENSAGEFVGHSVWSDEIVTTGGTTGDFFDNEMVLLTGQSLCMTTAADGMVMLGTEACDASNTLFTLDATDVTADPTATLLMGSSVTDIHADGGRRELTKGLLSADARVSFDVDLSLGEPIPPSCGRIDSDPQSDFCPDTGLALTDFFVVSADGTLLTITSEVLAIASFNGLDSISLMEPGFYVLSDEFGEPLIEVEIESFIDAAGQQQVVGRFTLVDEGAPYDPTVSTSYSVTSPSYLRLQTSNGQPVDLDVRFVRDGEMKVVWFLPPPAMPIAGDHDVNGDGTTDVTVTYDAGMWSFVFDANLTGVEQFGLQGATPLAAEADGTFLAMADEAQGYTEFGLKFDTLRYNLFVEMYGNGEGNLGWYEVFGGGDGGGPGDCPDCPVSMFDFGLLPGDTLTLSMDEAGFNLDQLGSPLIVVSATDTNYTVSLPDGSSAMLGRYNEVTGEPESGTSFDFPRGLTYPAFVDYWSDMGNYYFELFDTGFDIVVRIYDSGDVGPGPGDGDGMHDSDMDGVMDMDDNCVAIANADQLDSDGNGVGDACDVAGIPDLTGVYLATLSPGIDALEYDHELGDCVAMEGGTFLMDVKMQGNQVIIDVRGEEAHLVGVVETDGSFQLLGDDRFMPGPGQFTTDVGFSFNFSEMSGSDDGVIQCSASAGVSATLPSPVVEETEMASTAFNWFEADVWMDETGMKYGWFERGRIDGSNPEVQYEWKFSQSDWEDVTASNLDDFFVLTDTGVQILDDIYIVTSYGTGGETVTIEPTMDGAPSAMVAQVVDVSAHDVSGLPASAVVDKAFAEALPADVLLSSGAKLYVGTITPEQPIYEFDCDHFEENPWFADNLNCDNIVALSWQIDGSGVNVPTPATSLNEIVNSTAGTTPPVGAMPLSYPSAHGRIVASLASDDGTTNGANLTARFVRIFNDGSANEFLTAVPASIVMVGATEVVSFDIPAMLQPELDLDSSTLVVFVESTLEGSAYVRVGGVRGAEPVMLYNDVLANDIVANFNPDSSQFGSGDNGPGNGDPIVGEQLYMDQCSSCHTDNPFQVSGVSVGLLPPQDMYSLTDGSPVDLVQYIVEEMPQGGVGDCPESCALDIVAWFQTFQTEPQDSDGDGIPDSEDPAPFDPTIPNSEPPMESGDLDGDLVMDHEDNCVLIPNADQADTDQNGLGDACDMVVADISGFYLADLTVITGAEELDFDTGVCVPMVDATMTLDVHMEGNQVFMFFDGDQESSLYGVMGAGDVLDILGDEGFTPSTVAYTASSISFDFTSEDTFDTVVCNGGGSVVANRPTPIAAQSAFDTGIVWIEAWQDDFDGDGVVDEQGIEHGLITSTVLEVISMWDPSTGGWLDISSESAGGNFFLTPMGVQEFDDLYAVSGFNGDQAIIVPTQTGNWSTFGEEAVSLAEMDLTGVPMVSLLGEDFYGIVSEDAQFAAGAMAYHAKIEPQTETHYFWCDDDYDPWFETNLVCDNVVPIDWNPDGSPVPATSLDQIINMAGGATAQGGLYIGNGFDDMGEYTLEGVLVSSDGTTAGTGLMVDIIMRHHSTGSVTPMGSVDAVLSDIAGHAVISYTLPHEVTEMSDADSEDLHPFVFVEQDFEGTPYVRRGERNEPSNVEETILFNPTALNQIEAQLPTLP